MKIAFFVNRFPVLSQTFILNQITGLLDRGHAVDIYAYRPGNEPSIHADVERYDLLKRTCYMTRYISMPTNKTYRLIKGIGRIAVGLPKKPRVVLNSLNVLKFGKRVASLRVLYQIAPFLDRGRYDIIHCHFGPLGNLAIMLKAVGALQGKLVTTFRGYDISSYLTANGQHIYDELFKSGDLFLCVSAQIKNTLRKLGCDEQKINVHRSGVHLSKFHFQLRKPKTNEKIRLLTVGRLVEKKGIQYGVQAVAKFLKNYPNIEYRIVGDGPLKDTLQELIEELKVCGNIKLLGWQKREQIIELLQEADIFLAPSVTSQNGDREGIPGTIIEALACGLPVLSTWHSGIPEVVQDGESGFLVPERDTDILAEKLQYLIENTDLWAEMGRKGRRYVEEHYDIDKLNDRLVEIYQQLLSGHHTE